MNAMKSIVTGVLLLAAGAAGAGEVRYQGAAGGAWETAGNWSGGAVPTADDDVVIEGVAVTVASSASAKSLTLKGAAAVSVFGKTAKLIDNANAESELRVGRDAADFTATPVSLTVAGNLSLAGTSWIALGGFGQQAKSTLSVGGDLTLADSSTLAVYAGPATPADDRMVGGAVTVAGTFAVNDTATYSVHGDIGLANHPGTGASVKTVADVFTVAAGARVIANSGASIYTGTDTGIPAHNNLMDGSAHGGRAGLAGSGKLGSGLYSDQATYDSLFAPILPGRQPHYLANFSGMGGGVIRVFARTISISGLLDASCTVWWHGGLEMAGGAGGSVFLAGDTVTLAPEAQIRADGGHGGMHINNKSQCVGGGGGGRLAVATGVSATDLAALESGTYEISALATAALDSVCAGASAKGGLGAYTGGNGEAGTMVLYRLLAADKALAAVDTRGVVEVTPGVATAVTPASAIRYLNAAQSSRQQVTGSVCGGVESEGASREVTVAAGAETAVAWTYGSVEHRLAAAVTGAGTVSVATQWVAEGTTATVTATPAAGETFVAWLVDGLLTRTALTNATLQIAMDAPHDVCAVFSSAAFAGKSFTGATGGRWDDPANWTPAGVPTFADAVTIPSGVTVDGGDGVLHVGSLTLGENAILSVFGAVTDPLTQCMSKKGGYKDGRKARDIDRTEPIGLLVADALAVGAGAKLAVGGYGMACPGVVAVGGDFTVAAGGRAFVYPGPAVGLAALMRGGSRVFVAGETTIAGELETYGHVAYRVYDSGSGVVLDFGKATVEEGGGVYSRVGTSWCSVSSDVIGGGVSSAFAGTGHGGKGGDGNSAGNTPTGGGATFGKDFAPIENSLPAGNSSVSLCGAGSVHLKATDLTVNGTISASAVFAMYPLTTECGGIAGGSVWILAGKLTAGKNARFTATGTEGGTHTTTAHRCGGGGGGRIAVGVNLSEEQVASLEAWEYPEDIAAPVPLAGLYIGQVDVAGGKGIYGGLDGGEGTALYYEVTPPGLHSLTVVAEPAGVPVEVTPGIGVNSVSEADDTVVEVTTPYIYLNAERTRRMSYVGYVVSNETREVKSGGETRIELGKVTENLALTLRFGGEENLVSLSTAGEGTVSTTEAWVETGASATLTATPGSGSSFRLWAMDGIASPRQVRSAAIDFSPRQPMNLIAIFDDEAELAAKTFTGAANDGGKWETDGNWDPAGVPGVGDAVTIPAGKTVDLSTYVTVGSLTLADGAALSQCGASTKALTKVYSKGSLSDGRKVANAAGLKALGLIVIRDLAVGANAQLVIGGYGMTSPSVVSVGGDFTVAAGGQAYVYPGPAATLDERMLGGGRMTVAGETVIAGELQTYGHIDALDAGTGAGVVLDFARTTVAEGGVVRSCMGLGYKSEITSFTGGKASSRFDGTGHGGRGGKGCSAGGTPSGGGAAFGCAFAPIEPSRPANNDGASIAGVGPVRLLATELTVNGTVSASAVPDLYHLGTENGGTAGGSVWILAGTLTVGEKAKFSASGAPGGLHTTQSHMCGGGGGGRIAVGVNLSETQLAQLERQVYPDDLDQPVALASVFVGQVDVSGGEGRFSAPNGEDGTAVYYRVAPPGEHALTVRTDPEGLSVSANFAPGIHTVGETDSVAVTLAEPYAYLNPERTRRMTCTGYVVSNRTAEVARGTTLTADLGKVTENLTVTFNFANEEYAVDVKTSGAGTVSPDCDWVPVGSTVTLTAQPAANGGFRLWALDDSVAVRAVRTPRISFALTRPLRVLAVFERPDALTAKTFTGAASDGGKWETAGNWDPVGVPGVGDAVTVPAGLVVDLATYATVGSLTVENGARVSVAGATTALYQNVYRANDGRRAATVPAGTGVGLAVAGDVTLNGSAVLVIGGFNLTTWSALNVGGDLTLNGTSQLMFYSGPAGTERTPYALGGGRVTVAGAMSVNDTASCQPYGDIGRSFIGTAAHPVWDLNTLTVASGASFVSQIGCDQFIPTSLLPNASNTSYSGSGHGGQGATGQNGTGGAAYDWPYAPRWPGRESRPNGCNDLGAGVVHIEARSVRLSGTINVSPRSFAYTTETGGASGGSVWIVADSFKAKPGAKILAWGHDGGIHTAQMHRCGGGAGGCVAISLNLSEKMLDAFRATGTCDSGLITYTDLRTQPEAIPNLTVDVHGGENRIGVTGESFGQAEDGTAWLVAGPRRGLVLLVR